MRLLLDTHAFLWGLEASDRLSASARAAMQDIANHKFVSHASLWKITIKAALGKLRLLEPWGETLRQIERRVPGTVLLAPLRTWRSSASCPATTATPSTACSSRRRSPTISPW